MTPDVPDRATLAQLAPTRPTGGRDAVWRYLAAPTLSAREACTITLAILASLGRVQQLPWHIAFARQNGLSRDELEELFTHLAFYAGLPAAVTAWAICPPEEVTPCR